MAALTVSPVATAAPSSSVSLSGSQPAFVAHSRDLGAVNANRAVDFEVLLALPDQAAVQAEAKAVSTPGSASFRHYLTPAQFRAAYSPSPATVAATEAWVRQAGLHVASVAPSRMYVEVTGTMGRAEKLVGTSLHTFSYEGLNLAEPVSSYKVPAGLAKAVSGIVNLDDSALLTRPQLDNGSGAASSTATQGTSPDNTLPGPPPGAYYGVQPCSAYYGQKVATTLPPAYGQHWPYTICGYNPTQYEKAFGLYDSIAGGHDGNGVTVAITDAYASPTVLQDANRWSRTNGLPKFTSGQFTQDTPSADGYNLEKACGGSGWYEEETLDVESVHTMAPGAHVLYMGGKNCAGGLDTAWATVIDKHLASVETDSWGDGTENLPQGLIHFYNQYLLEAATTGVTVLFSSGDSGDEVAATGTKQVSLPASDPYATAVGGTSTEIGQNGKIVFQTGWSNFYSSLQGSNWSPKPPGNFSSGAGGGTSVKFKQPWYQRGVVPPKISEYFGSTPMRAVPDVAMPADPNTGLRIGETMSFPGGDRYITYRLGGTSLASPLFAGVVADAIQHNHGAAIGFINPLLYKDIDTAAITDVQHTSGPEATVRTNLTNPTNPKSARSYVLQTIGVNTTIFTGPGYDDITGVGTPNGEYFLQAMKY
jgi:subtilase family serine protease